MSSDNHEFWDPPKVDQNDITTDPPQWVLTFLTWALIVVLGSFLLAGAFVSVGIARLAFEWMQTLFN